jgi:hypothetical protein
MKSRVREPRHGSTELDPLTITATPQDPNYRVSPIQQGFDWPGIFASIAASRDATTEDLYLVVFRSVRKPNVDGAWITMLDEAAHTEAKQSSALLHYFAGSLDDGRRAISWCLWTDRTAARLALSGPAHQEAAREARELYDTFSIELYDVSRTASAQAIFTPLQRPQPS